MKTENNNIPIGNEQGLTVSLQKIQSKVKGYKCTEEIALLIEDIDTESLNNGDLLLSLSLDEAQKLMTALKHLLNNKKTFYKNVDGLTIRYRLNTKGYDIDVKLNDTYAKALGYSDLGDLLSFDNGTPFENLMDKFGCVPKYLPLKVNGEDSDLIREANMIQEWDRRNKNI